MPKLADLLLHDDLNAPAAAGNVADDRIYAWIQAVGTAKSVKVSRYRCEKPTVLLSRHGLMANIEIKPPRHRIATLTGKMVAGPV